VFFVVVRLGEVLVDVYAVVVVEGGAGCLGRCQGGLAGLRVDVDCWCGLLGLHVERLGAVGGVCGRHDERL